MDVYRRTFAVGWVEAVEDLTRTPLLILTLTIVALVAVIAWLLWRATESVRYPSRKQLTSWLVVGLLLILPSIGVLIWTDAYSRDLWRLYLFVPIPAAIIVFSAIAMLTSPIKKPRLRNAAIVVISLVLMLPATARLLEQHEHYVTSANSKAKILSEILRLTPGIDNSTRVIVFNDMPADILEQKHIEEMYSNMIGSALFVIYEGRTSGYGALCPLIDDCFPFRRWEGDFSDTLVFLLDENLELRLVEEPHLILEEFSGLNYDADSLYDSNAPLPSRAFTMLGMSAN